MHDKRKLEVAMDDMAGSSRRSSSSSTISSSTISSSTISSSTISSSSSSTSSTGLAVVLHDMVDSVDSVVKPPQTSLSSSREIITTVAAASSSLSTTESTTDATTTTTAAAAAATPTTTTISSPGVVYLSRIPPYMKPIKLRQLLNRYSQTHRIYLVPESAKQAAARRKRGGNKKRTCYTEGWVEFKDKKMARRVANMLNGKTIGGKKRSFYYDDLWTIKYLPKFRWDDLTAQMRYEKAVEEHKLAAEVRQAKRETEAYLANVGKAKMIAGIESKKQKKKQEQQQQEEEGINTNASLLKRKQFGGQDDINTSITTTTSADTAGSAAIITNKKPALARHFRQRQTISSSSSHASGSEPSSVTSAGGGTGHIIKTNTKLKSVLSKIFNTE